MITIFCLALNVMTISGKSPVEHSFTFKLTMIVNCYLWRLFPQVPLSATRCTRLHLRCSPDLKEQPISTAHTALRTTIKSRNDAMLFLGYMFATNKNPEVGLGVNMTGSANQHQTCTLTMERVALNSSAVYFCAAWSHCGAYGCSSVQEAPHHTSFLSP